MSLILYNEVTSDWDKIEGTKQFEEAMEDRFCFYRRGFAEIRNTDTEDIEFLEAYKRINDKGAKLILATIKTGSTAFIDRIDDDEQPEEKQ